MSKPLTVAILAVFLATMQPRLATTDDVTASVAVDFDRQDLEGRRLRLSDYRGKWVVVNFWATWCGPCLREIPMLIELDRERPDVTVIGVNFEEIGRDALVEFVASMGIGYPVVRAGAEPMLPFEPLKGLPSTFVVSPAGHLVAGWVGEVDQAWIHSQVGE